MDGVLVYTVNYFYLFPVITQHATSKSRTNVKLSLYLKKAGLASRNIVHTKKILLRCVDFCFYFLHFIFRLIFMLENGQLTDICLAFMLTHIRKASQIYVRNRRKIYTAVKIHQKTRPRKMQSCHQNFSCLLEPKGDVTGADF